MFSKKKQPDQLSRYIDPSGTLTNKELNAGQWYVRHKIGLARAGTILLAVIAISLFGYGLVFWGEYLIFGYTQDQAMSASQRASFTDVTELRNSYTPKPLEIGNADIFQSGSDKYDFVTRVTNPNSRYIANIKYQYIFDGGVTETRDDVLLPGSEHPVGFFGYSSPAAPVAARLVIQQISWQRLNPHVYKNPEQFARDRLNFSVNNVLFVRGGDSAQSSHHISFDVKNDTAYSYWQPVFYVDFLQGDVVTGVAYLTLDQFRSGEQRHIDMASLAPGLFATDIRLWPAINVFDKNTFMSPGQ